MIKLFRILFFPLAFIRFVLLILSNFFYLCTSFIEARISLKNENFKFWTLRNWGKTNLFILGILVKKNKHPLSGKYLLMPNHRGYIDIFLVAAYSPSAFVAKAELLTWPLIGHALKLNRVITVNRKEMKSLINTLNSIKQTIDNNIPVTVFPEGTTSKGPELLPFKKGIFKIASDLQIPVIPCAIKYRDTNDSFFGKDRLPFHIFRQFWKPISFASIQFADSIQSNDANELLSKTKESIELMLFH